MTTRGKESFRNRFPCVRFVGASAVFGRAKSSYLLSPKGKSAIKIALSLHCFSVLSTPSNQCRAQRSSLPDRLAVLASE